MKLLLFPKRFVTALPEYRVIQDYGAYGSIWDPMGAKGTTGPYRIKVKYRTIGDHRGA